MTARDLLDRILETKHRLAEQGVHDAPIVIYIGSDHYAEVRRTLHADRFLFINVFSCDGDRPGRDFDFCGYPGHVVSTPDYLHIAIA